MKKRQANPRVANTRTTKKIKERSGFPRKHAFHWFLEQKLQNV
jgi:hypothetical protein